jgi:uncharacterized protein
MSLKNKIVVITGASQGLGKTLAQKVSAEGAIVLLVSRSIEKLKQLETTIPHTKAFPCDIRKLEEVKNTVKDIIGAYHRIDILINNAGIWTDDEIEKNDTERRKTAIETNILGQIQVTEELLPAFKQQNYGTIFNVISTAGVADIPSGDNRYWKTYGATKWGFTGYTQSLRESLRDTKIKVIQYFPGGFDSNLYENAKRDNPHGQPWMMKTDDVADIIIFSLTRPEDVYMEKIVVSKMMH